MPFIDIDRMGKERFHGLQTTFSLNGQAVRGICEHAINPIGKSIAPKDFITCAPGGKGADRVVREGEDGPALEFVQADARRGTDQNPVALWMTSVPSPTTSGKCANWSYGLKPRNTEPKRDAVRTAIVTIKPLFPLYSTYRTTDTREGPIRDALDRRLYAAGSGSASLM